MLMNDEIATNVQSMPLKPTLACAQWPTLKKPEIAEGDHTLRSTNAPVPASSKSLTPFG